MRKFIILSMAIGLLTTANSIAQVGIGTNQPDKSAVLDVVSTQRGLLIPRIALTSTTSTSPIVGTPANSLMVYNTATVGDVVPGFYYWDSTNTKWILILTDNNIPTTATTSSVSGLGNIIVTPTTTGSNTDYAVEIAPGLDGQVLVTQLNTTTNDLEPVWVDPNMFISNVGSADNGLTQTTDTNGDPLIELGGTLTHDTDIDAAGFNFSLSNLGQVTSADSIVVKVGDVLRVIPSTDLMTKARNGLSISNDSVVLGGTLDRVTTIATDATNTLNISGLQAADAANKIVVAEDATGELATVKRMVFGSIPTTGLEVNATNLPDYSHYVGQVFLEIDVVDLSGGDVNLTLPDPVAATGQVINVKIVDPGTNGDASNYLNILKFGTTSPSPASTLSYGAVPFQAWVLKSDGTNWRIVSSK